MLLLFSSNLSLTFLLCLWYHLLYEVLNFDVVKFINHFSSDLSFLERPSHPKIKNVLSSNTCRICLLYINCVEFIFIYGMRQNFL